MSISRVTAPGASFVIAGRRADGSAQVEVFEREAGVWWLERRMRDRCEHPTYPILSIAWDHGGPARAVAPELERGAQGVAVQKLNGAEWAAACGAFATAVSEGRVHHLGDLLLADAVRGAQRRELGRTGWVWDLATATADITPLLAATAALRALETVPAPPPTFAGSFHDLGDS